MHIIKTLRLVTAAALLTVVATPAVSFAITGSGETGSTERSMTRTISEQKTEKAAQRQAEAQARQEARQAKLTDAKLQACKKREAKINRTLTRIADRGQKQLTVFTSIADKTKAFYADKGRTVANYDALVAEVDAKKLAAQTAVDAVKAQSVTFNCDGADPKGAAESFKAALKSEIAALKDYKTAVKNLIVGVKSAQSTTTTQTDDGGNQ